MLACACGLRRYGGPRGVVEMKMEELVDTHLVFGVAVLILL